MRLSQSNAGAAGRLGGVGGGGGGAGCRVTSGGDAGRAGVADGAGPAAGGAWTGRGGGGDGGSGRSATRGSGTVSGAGGGTGLSAAGGTGAGGTTRGGTTGATGGVGSGRTAAAGGEMGGDGASRDSWVTRERSSSISFSCDSTTRRSVSSRRAVLRADTQAAIGRTKGMTSRISAKKRISTVPRPRAGGAPPGIDSFVAGVYSSYTEPPSLVSSHSSDVAGGLPAV